MADTDNGTNYFIRVRGRVLGPYDVAQLKTLRGRGQFGRANEVSTDRQTWQSAASIEHLFPETAKAVNRQSPSKEASSSDSSAPPQPDAGAPARKASPGWHYAVGSEQLGPVSLLELRGLIATKQLTPNDLVWREGLAEWTPLREIAEIGLPANIQSNQLAASAKSPTGLEDDANERQLLFDSYALMANLRRAGLTGIFPFQAWFRDRPLSLVWVQLLVFLFSFPLLLGQYYEALDAPLVEVAWALSLYFAIVGAAILHRCVRPEPIGMGRICGVWLFTGFLGVVAVVVASELGGLLPFVRDAFVATKSASILGRWVGMTLSVGFVEELAKAIPLLWIVSRSSKSMTLNTGVFLGCISGLAFGSTEAVVYSFQYAAGHAASLVPTYGDYILVQVLRFVSLPLLHGVWSGIAGYFIVLGKASPGSRGSMVVLGLALVSVLHGTYNTLVSYEALGWYGAIVAMISLLLFIGYIRGEPAVGRSAVGTALH